MSLNHKKANVGLVGSQLRVQAMKIRGLEINHQEADGCKKNKTDPPTRIQ